MIRRFFRALWNTMKAPWAITLTVTLILVLLVWLLGPLVAIADTVILKSVTARLVATVILAFLWGIFVAFYYSRSRKKQLADPEKAQKLEEEYISKSRFREEMDYVRDRIKAAIRIVTKSNFYGPKSRSRYVLPWYLVLGTANSGKTSFLLNSGLKFPLNEQADRHLYQLKATERFDALYSNEAVFIDTPGAFTESLPDTPQNRLWSFFLRRLFRAKPARPLNGVVMCVSMREIMDTDAARREHLARTIRERLSDVLKNLRTYVPVYLVFTKCDAVPGFAQFFAHLSRHEREQMFGCLARENSMEPGMVRSELKELMQTLNAQVITKIHQERDVPARGEMFRFPQELASLGERLEDFIAEAFGPSRYHKPVVFRGFFFTSALSSNDIIGQTARDGELPYQTGFQPSMSGDYAKGYFLLKLLQDCIIPEARLAGTDKAHIWPMRIKRYGMQIAAGVLFLLGASFLGISFINNYSSLDTIQAEYTAFVNEQKKVPAVAEAKDPLPELSKLAMTTLVYNPEEDEFLSYGLGLYQGVTFDQATHKAYLGTLNSRLMPALRDSAAQKIDKNLNNVSELKSALRAYLMLCQPRYIEERFLNPWLEKQWSERYHGLGNVQANLRDCMDYLLANGIVPVEPDADLLDRARKALMKVPLAELAYQRMKEEAEESGKPPFTFRAAIGESPFQGDTYEIPALYTLVGYEEYLVKRCPDIIRSLTDESWIYGEKSFVLSMLDVNKVHKEVRTMYFRDYTQLWGQAVQELNIPVPGNLTDARNLAEKMTAGISPVVMVLREIRTNTTFVSEKKDNSKVEDALSYELQRKARQKMSRRVGARLAGALSQEAAKSAEEMKAKAMEESQRDARAVRQFFQPFDSLLDTEGNAGPSLKAANDAMANARDYFGKLLTSDNTERRVLSALLEIADEKDNTLRNVESTAERLHTPVRNWYTTVTNGALQRMLFLGATTINKVYQENVIGSYNRNLRGKYPFDARSDRDVNLDDFGAFFRAGGTLDNFHDTYLRPFISSTGQLRSIMGRTLPVSTQSIMQFNRANRVQDAFFLSGREVGINFLLETHALDATLKQVTLASADKSVNYFHGPVSGSGFNWPEQSGASSYSTLEFIDLNGITTKRTTRGDWALFRLFKGGTIKRRSGSTCLLEVQQNGKWVQFLIQFRNKANPFDPAVCSFALPSSLM